MNFETILALLKRFRISFKDNIKLIIYSMVMAIIVWFFISATVYPIITPTIKDVPIKIDLSGTSAERNGLSVIKQEIENVTVQIEGNRSEIGDLTSSDLVAKAIIENITTAGKYQLSLEVASKSGKQFNVLSIRPSTVPVTFDKIVSKNFPLEAEAPNANAADGYMKGTPIVSPNTITVTGPEEQINKITKCVVKTDYGTDKQPLTESYEVTSGNQLILYSGDKVMDTSNLNINQTNFSVSIPIYMKKTLAFKIRFTNLPTGFPLEDLKFNMDYPSIEVAGPSSKIQNINDYLLGYIDLRDIDIGSVFNFPVELDSDFQNLSGIQNVSVSFESEGLAKKTLNIKNKNISFINVPANFDVETVTSGWTVTFIGYEDIIKNLSAQDVVAQVDLLGLNLKNGEYFNNPITFIVPNKGCVWAYDSYTATFKAKSIAQ